MIVCNLLFRQDPNLTPTIVDDGPSDDETMNAEKYSTLVPRSIRSKPGKDMHFLRSLREGSHFLRSLRAPNSNFLRPLRSTDHMRALRGSQAHFLRSLRAPEAHFLRSLRAPDAHFLRSLRAPETHFLRSFAIKTLFTCGTQVYTWLF